ncbi:MAG TPA: DUF4339 domain-containing protein, partial [Pirellulales bacterium]
MGIKFNCPNGHKMHVKSFLAGKKGLCPRCGVRVEIPLQSTRGTTDEAEGQEIDPRFENSAGDGLGLAPLDAASQPGLMTATTEADFLPPTAAAQFTGADVGLPRGAAPTTATGSELLQEIDADLPPTVSGPQWHLQLASGEQHGPVENDVVTEWIANGRIAADTMVWRDGWSQWQPAGGVFAQFSTPKPAAAIPTSQWPAADDPISDILAAVQPNTAKNTHHRGYSKTNTATLSLVLIGIVV